MTGKIVMEEDGSVTLPADLIARLGWTFETALRRTDEDQGVALGPVSDPDMAYL